MQSIMNTVDMILLYIYTADFECHPYEEEEKEEEANLLLFFLVVLLLLELRMAPFSYYLFLGTFAVVCSSSRVLFLILSRLRFSFWGIFFVFFLPSSSSL